MRFDEELKAGEGETGGQGGTTGARVSTAEKDKVKALPKLEAGIIATRMAIGNMQPKGPPKARTPVLNLPKAQPPVLNLAKFKAPPDNLVTREELMVQEPRPPPPRVMPTPPKTLPPSAGGGPAGGARIKPCGWPMDPDPTPSKASTDVDLSGGTQNTAEAWMAAYNMGREPTDPEYMRAPIPKVGTLAAPVGTVNLPRTPQQNVPPVPLPKPKMNRVASQPGFATSFLGEITGEGGDGAGTPRVNEMPRTISVSALIRREFPNPGVLGHVNQQGKLICVGPGTVPIRPNGYSSATSDWEFYVQAKHPEPIYRRTEFGARLLRWPSTMGTTPVSNTTGHFFSTDHKLAPADLYLVINKLATELGVELTAVYYDRHTGSRGTTRYEPTGHTFFAIAPGNNTKLMLMVELLDKLTFPISFADHLNTQTGTYEVVSTSVTGCQLSTQELVAFQPHEQQYSDRDPLVGPKYFGESRASYMMTELDIYGWYGRTARGGADAGLPAVEHYLSGIVSDYQGIRAQMQDCYGNEAEFGRSRPEPRMGSAYGWLGGKSFRARTYGHAERLSNNAWDVHMANSAEYLSKNLHMVRSEAFHPTRLTPNDGTNVPGAYSLYDTKVLRDLMRSVFQCEYQDETFRVS